MEHKFNCAAGEKCQMGRREHVCVDMAAEKSYFPAHAAPCHHTCRTRAAPAAVLVAAQLQGFPSLLPRLPVLRWRLTWDAPGISVPRTLYCQLRIASALL